MDIQFDNIDECKQFLDDIGEAIASVYGVHGEFCISSDHCKCSELADRLGAVEAIAVTILTIVDPAAAELRAAAMT